MKLVFNWIFEVLEEKLSALNHPVLIPEEQFISYYFKSVSSKTGQSIRRFLRPTQNNPKRGGPRSFNANFLHSISQSKIFMDDLCHILEVEYLDAMQNIMYQRLLEMTKRWQEVLKKSEVLDPMIVCEQLKCSRKLKMPWSFCEILSARETVLKTLCKKPNVSSQ